MAIAYQCQGIMVPFQHSTLLQRGSVAIVPKEAEQIMILWCNGAIAK
jgi:hypothetical protein